MDLPNVWLPRLVMSHHYTGQQQYQESLTTPSTPQLQYPTWETLDNMSHIEQNQSADSEDPQPQQQQQHQAIDPSDLMSTSHGIEEFTMSANTIQLAHPQPARSEDLSSPTTDNPNSAMRPGTSSGSASAAGRSSARAPLRQSPATRMHPYPRPQSAAPIASSATSARHPRGPVARSPQVTTTPIIPIPASTMSTPPSADPRIISFGSGPSSGTPYTSPSTMQPPQLPHTPSEIYVQPFYPPPQAPPHNPIPQYPPQQQSRPAYQYPQFPAQPPSQLQQHPPRLQVQTQSVRPAQAPISSLPRQRYVPRSDVQYDPRTNVLTACLEMPGVRRDDLRVTLSTCLFNRIRQVVVRGCSYPVFAPVNVSSQDFPGAQSASASTSATPAIVGLGDGRSGGIGARNEANYSLRERKYGEFSRTFIVPSDTKPEDVQVYMENGVLMVRISCGLPAMDEDSHVIPIR